MKQYNIIFINCSEEELQTELLGDSAVASYLLTTISVAGVGST